MGFFFSLKDKNLLRSEIGRHLEEDGKGSASLQRTEEILSGLNGLKTPLEK